MFVYIDSKGHSVTFNAEVGEVVSFVVSSKTVTWTSPFEGLYAAHFNNFFDCVQITGDKGYYFDISMSTAPEEPKCECGSASLNSPGHSHWCKLYSKI